MNKYVKLLPVNAATLNEQTGAIAGLKDSDIIKGLQYVYVLHTQEGSSLKGKVKVVNMSIGGWNDPNTYYNMNNTYAKAIKLLGDSGVIVCISSGNDCQNINNPGTRQVTVNGKKLRIHIKASCLFPQLSALCPELKT